MIKSLIMICGTYPLLMSTGLFPRNRLALNPKFSFLFASTTYPLLCLIRYGVDAKSVVSILFYGYLTITFVKTRYVVPVFLGWAATDVVAYLVSISTTFWWDHWILVIYFLRSHLESPITGKLK